MSTYMFRLVCVWAPVHTVDKYVYCFFSFYSISPSVLPLLSGILLRNAFFLQGTLDFFPHQIFKPSSLTALFAQLGVYFLGII